MKILKKLKDFPYKAICAVGIIYLLNSFIAGLHPNTFEIIALPLLLYLLISAVRNLAISLSAWRVGTEQFATPFRRFLLALFILLFPAAKLGADLKIGLFLRDMPRYQQMVQAMLEEEEKSQNRSQPQDVPVPAAYKDLCPYWVGIDYETNAGDIVQFMTDDWGFPARHQGYIYISNDDPSTLKGILRYSDCGFYRIAPKWYEWDD